VHERTNIFQIMCATKKQTDALLV